MLTKHRFRGQNDVLKGSIWIQDLLNHMTLWYLKEKKNQSQNLEFENSDFFFTCIGTASGGEELGETILIFAGPVKNTKK